MVLYTRSFTADTKVFSWSFATEKFWLEDYRSKNVYKSNKILLLLLIIIVITTIEKWQ